MIGGYIIYHVPTKTLAVQNPPQGVNIVTFFLTVTRVIQNLNKNGILHGIRTLISKQSTLKNCELFLENMLFLL